MHAVLARRSQPLARRSQFYKIGGLREDKKIGYTDLKIRILCKIPNKFLVLTIYLTFYLHATLSAA